MTEHTITLGLFTIEYAYRPGSCHRDPMVEPERFDIVIGQVTTIVTLLGEELEVDVTASLTLKVGGLLKDHLLRLHASEMPDRQAVTP